MKKINHEKAPVPVNIIKAKISNEQAYSLYGYFDYGRRIFTSYKDAMNVLIHKADRIYQLGKTKKTNKGGNLNSSDEVSI